MRRHTLLDHEQRIEAAVRYLAAHLDERIDLRDLADHVCLSRFHFHRVFQALLGETVGELHRRLRLERAAERLRSTRVPITEVAFEAGYATHEAFIRAFRAAFGYAPSTLRRRLTYDGRLPTRNGVHYGGELEIQFVAQEGEIRMEVEIREAPPRKAVCMAHSGPYFMIGRTFGALGAWLGETRTETGRGVALYYDDPSTTPADELRSDAGAFVADGFETADPRVHVVNVPGGAFAVGTHHGPYDGLPAAWDEMRKWINASGRAYRDAPSFEVYLNNCMDTAPADLLTELYVPVQ
ncbi:MAG TPA: AraC family transcriptional regulator [Chthonomonadaceae bacterium]|nr:AraC family transcriptional regulator [Chthonomonadaceae bacterium]